MNRSLGLALSLLLCGCGSLNGPQAGGLATPSAQPNGTVYAVTTSTDETSLLQVFHGLNGSSSGVSGVAAIQLTAPLALSVAVNPGADTVYVGCAGSGTPVLLVYNFASQLNGTAATPNATIPLTGAPIAQSYDPVRDALYIATPNGVVNRITSASRLNSPSPIGLTTPQGNLAELVSLLADSSADRLLALGTTDSTNPITSLPVFDNASSSLTSNGAITPPGLVGPISVRAGDAGRLLLLDLGGSAASSADSPTRVVRYETSNNYSDPPTLTLSVPNALCFNYSAAQDRLYTGLKNGQILVLNNASRLSGSPPLSSSLTLQTTPVAPVSDLAIDPSH